MPTSFGSPRHVLVTGVGGPSGEAAVTALKARGFRVIASDMREVRHAADAFILLPPAADSGFIDALREAVAVHKVDWLFPTVSDELVKVADAAEGFRRAGVAVYIGTPQAVRLCHDKWETARHLERAGVPVPASALGPADAPAVQALGFPVVTRPRVGRGGRGVVVHDRPGVPPASPEVIWQTFMPGTEYDVLLVRHPDPPHAVLARQVFRKTALREGRVGNALELEPVTAQDVASLAETAARTLGLTGPMDMDIRRDAGGAPRVLEVNARIGAHTLRAPGIFAALFALFDQGHLGCCC